jgi:hypothetical protein
MLDEPKPIGIDHNNPPEEIEDSEAVEKLRTDVAALHAEFGKTNPSISFVKKLGTTLRNATLVSVEWAGRKVDPAIDTAIKTGIPAAGIGLAAKYSGQLHETVDAVMTWLDIVAHKL